MDWTTPSRSESDLVVDSVRLVGDKGVRGNPRVTWTPTSPSSMGSGSVQHISQDVREWGRVPV